MRPSPPLQSYLELSFTDGSNPLDIKQLDIWTDGGKLVKTKSIDGATTFATEAEPLTITPATATDKLFFALRDENGAANNVHFKATNTSNKEYVYDGSKDLTAGKFYTGTIALTRVYATGHALSASVVGEIVGTDGLAYAVADVNKNDLPSGVSAAGIVVKKSATADESMVISYDGHGPTDYGSARDYAYEYTPAVTGKTWRLLTMDEWKQLFSANGGDEGNCSGLNAVIAAAGGTGLGNYWTSTLGGSGVYVLIIGESGSVSFTTQGGNDMPLRSYRVCFTF